MKSQRGGFAVGLIVGLLVGLALALGVALYVTKVPGPFVNKVPQRTAEQDAAEVERNKNWDPNGPLYGKNPARPSTAASGVALPATPREAAVVTPPPPDPGSTMPLPPPRVATPPNVGEPAATTTSTKSSADPFIYFVQAGAFARTEDAEQQRVRVAMLGFPAKLSEREQSGRTVYRVRVGPFDSKNEAELAKTQLVTAGVESSLVRVQK